MIRTNVRRAFVPPRSVLSPVLVAALAGSALAQVPDGWIVWGSFQGSTGQNGIFFSHPRDPNAPFVPVTNLAPALAYDPAAAAAPPASRTARATSS